ncbi:MAG: hypothetical protein JXN59_09365, partial [Anaerolineae bacterium]|nr:hypothetical protein [Anaerolineae bacterium]
TFSDLDDDDRPGLLVIQGPVREITPTSLRIFGLDIGLTPETLATSAIQVGDNVRVVGQFMAVDDTFRLMAVNITPLSMLLGRDSTASLRDSVSDDTASMRESNRASDRTSGSDTQSAPPPPPPASSSDDSNNSSRDSAASAASAASTRDSN